MICWSSHSHALTQDISDFALYPCPWTTDGSHTIGSHWVALESLELCRGGERGTARPEVLQSLLQTTERVVQEIDSVEYGLTDIQVGQIMASTQLLLLSLT